MYCIVLIVLIDSIVLYCIGCIVLYRIVLTTPAAIHRRPLETRDWGQIGRALAK